MTNKIPCYITAFFMFDFFKQTMQSLLKKSDKLDIKVVENYSKYTNQKFKPYIFDLISKGFISEYFLFEKNISSNAGREVAYNHIKHEDGFIIRTDGDLVLQDGWLEEQIKIMNNNKDVFAVGADLSLENLPKIEGADKWVPRAKKLLFKNYLLGPTGIWTVMFRAREFVEMARYFKDNGLVWVDAEMRNYAEKKNMKWARTKKTKAYHLTWDLDVDPNHEYHEFRKKPFQEKWLHNDTCGYVIYNKENVAI